MCDFLPKQVKKSLEEQHVKPETIKRYARWLKKAFNNEPFDYDKLSTLYNTSHFQKLKQEANDFSCICSAIIKVLITYGKLTIEDEVVKMYLKLKKNGNIQKPIINKKDKDERYKTPKELELIRDDLLKEWINDKSNIYMALKCQAMYLYTYIPPLRGQDYYNTSFSPDTSNNYIDLMNKQLIITEGKTIKKGSIRCVDIPVECIDIIEKVKEITKSKWLFPLITDKNKHMNHPQFSRLIQDCCGLNPTYLRNIYCSYYSDEGKSKQERIEIAKTMGHTLMTSITEYSKYTNDEKCERIVELEKENKRLKEEKEILKMALKFYLYN